MAELADALDSGSSTFTGVGVQLSLAAPTQINVSKKVPSLIHKRFPSSIFIFCGNKRHYFQIILLEINHDDWFPI